MTKPPCVQKPDDAPFELFHKPLKAISLEFQSLLKSEKRKPGRFWAVLWASLVSAHETYIAVCTLVETSRDVKFPSQAHTLSRSLIESLANILCLSEDPEARSNYFWRDGYRVMMVRYQRELNRYGVREGWKQELEKYKTFLDDWAKELGLTAEEAAEPDKKIPWWKTPGKMLQGGKPLVTGNRAELLREICDWWYGDKSSMAHHQFLGITAGVFNAAKDQQWLPGKFESDAVFDAMIFLACILSEIDVLAEYGKHAKLREVWTYLGTYTEPGKELYALRYDKLLKK